MALEDYRGRKLDIMMTSNYSGKLRFEFPNKVVAGIQKVVQNFILRFFTAIESNIVDSNAGTFFGKELPEAVQREKGYIYQVAAMAVTDAVSQMQAEQSNFDDENIQTARIKNFTESKGSAQFFIEVISKSGDAYNFIIPIDIPVNV